MLPRIIQYPLGVYIQGIERRDSFALARYGDGEWMCMLGVRGENCDGVQYTRKLRRDLLATLRQPHRAPYQYGLVRIARTKCGYARIVKFCRRRDIGIIWTEGTTFVDASRSGDLGPLVQALRKRDILYIGPEHLMGKMPFDCEYMPIPTPDAHEYVDDIVNLAETAYGRSGADLIGVSAGPAAKIVIHRMWREGRTIIDFGSLWDGFAGRMSRKYMRDPEWRKLKEVNLAESI